MKSGGALLSRSQTNSLRCNRERSLMNKINLKQKFSLINDHWQPHIAGELNGQYVKLGKFKGPFTWHHHEHEDELFLVVKGRFRMEYREPVISPETGAVDQLPIEERAIWVEEGEMIIVPRGLEHRTV